MSNSFKENIISFNVSPYFLLCLILALVFSECIFEKYSIQRCGTCWSNFPEKTHLFSSKEVDFSLFSGTFNLCFLNSHQTWEKYIFSNLKQSWLKSKFGIVLNLLCENKANIKNQIYYANRRQFISRATELFGPTYAISTPKVSKDVSFIITKHR